MMREFHCILVSWIVRIFAPILMATCAKACQWMKPLSVLIMLIFWRGFWEWLDQVGWWGDPPMVCSLSVQWLESDVWGKDDFMKVVLMVFVVVCVFPAFIALLWAIAEDWFCCWSGDFYGFYGMGLLVGVGVVRCVVFVLSCCWRMEWNAQCWISCTWWTFKRCHLRLLVEGA